MNKLLLIAPLLLMLGGCGQITTKTTGEVVSVENSADEQMIHVAFTRPGGKYGVASYQCDTAQQCSQFQVGSKIVVYYNRMGIEEVSK